MHELDSLSDGVDPVIVEHPFLAGLKPEFRHFLSDCGSLRSFAAQQQIFREGGEADHFYLIVSGSVILETFVPGCGMVTVQSLGSGDALGWSWLFPPYEWHFTATTHAPTEVISFGAAALRAKAQEDPSFHNEFLSRIANTLFQRLLSTRKQLIDFCGARS